MTALRLRTLSAVFAHPSRHALFVSVAVALVVPEKSASRLAELRTVESEVIRVASYADFVFDQSCCAIFAVSVPFRRWV